MNFPTLTIAGSDPSGGAGIQADLKVFHQLGMYGEAVITLITVQNTVGMPRVEPLPADLVREQVKAVIDDIPPRAAKTGALGSAEIVNAIADLAGRFRFPLVVDPVMIGKHGSRLLAEDAVQALRERLIPRAYVVTPNLPEAEALTGLSGDPRKMAERLREMGARAVLIKGGHSAGDPVDMLVDDSGVYEYASPRIPTRHTHGSGCTHSAALTSYLALGIPLVESARLAKQYICGAISTNPGLGAGVGPVNHAGG